MILTDTHTHLYSEQFDEDRDEVIAKAIQSGVERFFIPAIDSAYTQSMFRLKDSYPDHMYLMTGLHPTHVNDTVKEELLHVKEMLDAHSFVAVGEIGVDLYWSKEFKNQQMDAFDQQIGWAVDKNLPIAIHCREAFDEVFEVLEKYRGTSLKGVFHCFTGTKEQALHAIDLNLHLGIGGVVTFKNGKIDTFLNQLPLDRIVLETDAPYLAPVPFRGKRNESAYIVNVAQKIAELYGRTIEEVASLTTLNSKKIFGV